MRVSPTAGRSIAAVRADLDVVLDRRAPPTWGNLPVGAVGHPAKPKPSLPSTAPSWTTTRFPICDPLAYRHVAVDRASRRRCSRRGQWPRGRERSSEGRCGHLRRPQRMRLLTPSRRRWLRVHVRKPVGCRAPASRQSQNSATALAKARYGWRSEDRAGRAVSLVREDHRGCGGALQMSGVFGVGEEGEIAGAGFFDACHAHDVDVAISLELAVEAFGDVPQLQGRQYTTATGGGKPARAIIEGHSGIQDLMVHATVRTPAALLALAARCWSSTRRPAPRRGRPGSITR